MKSLALHLVLAATATAAVDLSKLPAPAGAPVDFTRQIAPIFEDKCVKCHGPEKQKSDYRLDVKAIALTGGEASAPNVLPGKSAESPLIHYVAGLLEDTIMPPKGERLSAEQIGLLRRWIDDGAVWPDHASAKAADPLDWWSLKPIVKPALPQGSSGHPVDAFITATLAKHDLAMAPEADARTLCRRVYFDLTGLPPTPEETDAFTADPAPDKYARLVDRLMASPRYGERWARHWLDVVHYGDTHGYDKDQPRPNAWPYRDYVIRALNEDKPYARFIQEQVAGDALFPGTRDGMEALGFIAAGPWDLIGHAEVSEDKIDGKIARHLDRDDMVANTIGTFASATVHCAQCHNHKFDPISQEDYYSLQAVFAALDRADKQYDLDPAVAARRAELNHRKQDLEAKEKAIADRVAKVPGLAELEKEIKAAEKAAQQGTRPEYGWHSAIENSPETRKWVQVDLGKNVTLERIVLAGVWDDFNGIGAGFGFPARFRIEASDDPQFRDVPQVIAAQDLVDFPNPGTAPQTFPAAGKTARYVRVTATKLAPRKNDFIFALSELQAFDSTGRNAAAGAAVTSLDSIEAPVRWTRQNLTDGIYPAATGGGERLAELRKQRDTLLAGALDERTRQERAEIAAGLDTVTRGLAKLPPTKVVFAGTIHTGSGAFRGTGGNGGAPRKIHLLARGQVTAPLRELAPGALSALAGLPSRFDGSLPDSERRAALARWLSHPSNPLTWRSIVNRVWLYHFGRGIVETPNDFGRMGGLPSHPELLEWLAVTFRDDYRGSMKQLHRLLLTSAVYKQASSVQNPRAAQLDSNNTLLWRQNRRKLEAEAVRDAVLAVSGKLDFKEGGPGWKDFVVKHPEHSPHYKYDLADPNDPSTWRRSIYRFIVRSQTQPFMTVLDCADPSMRVDKRNESVSPSQALALLNNGFMVTQATHFAQRLEKEAGTDPAAQVERGYRLATGRVPTPEEKMRLSAFASRHGLPNACRVILNLNEFNFVD